MKQGGADGVGSTRVRVRVRIWCAWLGGWCAWGGWFNVCRHAGPAQLRGRPSPRCHGLYTQAAIVELLTARGRSSELKLQVRHEGGGPELERKPETN